MLRGTSDTFVEYDTFPKRGAKNKSYKTTNKNKITIGPIMDPSSASPQDIFLRHNRKPLALQSHSILQLSLVTSTGPSKSSIFAMKEAVVAVLFCCPNKFKLLMFSLWPKQEHELCRYLV